MSLDFYLVTPGQMHRRESAIYIREGGSTVPISREEWDRRYPDREPVTLAASESEIVFRCNITHNLAMMAEATGLYQCLWRPEEIGITLAKQMIEPLEAGLECLKSDPDRYRQYNPSNGWGSYERLVEFAEAVLDACHQHPEAMVEACR